MDLEQLQQEFSLFAQEWNEKKRELAYRYLDLINALSTSYWNDRMNLTNDEQKQQLDLQHEQEKQEILGKQRQEERWLQEFYQPRIHTIVDRMIAIEAQDQTVSPYWRVRIISSANLAPSLQDLLQERQVYSQAGLQDLLRVFFKYPEDTKRCSPIDLEVSRVTILPPFITYNYVSLSRQEITERRVYFVDFHEEHNLIGHNDLQQEVLGAWMLIGGQFCHHVTEYFSEDDRWSRRPRGTTSIHVHRPLPERFQR